MFPSISFHITKHCNLHCKFCYATFNDFKAPILSLREAKIIISKLKTAGLKKITFAGGEPLLYPYIKEVIIFAKSIGLTTSIITNGILLTPQWLVDMKPYLDWIGLSIDSFNEYTNISIGRKHLKYLDLCISIQNMQYKLKINTVVNSYNKNEDFNKNIQIINPDRWKVLQVLQVKGQNDSEFNNLKVSNEEYLNFIFNHKERKCLVPETNNDITSSYLLIDCLGRFFDDTKGYHTYSKSVLSNSVEDCLKDIDISYDKFIQRGGLYNW